MHANTTIRQATRDDIDAVAPLFDSYRQFYGQEPDPAGARQFLAERLERGESTLFIAESAAHAAVGFTQLFPTFSSVAMARTYLLNDLFVIPGFRRHGIAQLLLTTAVAFCRSVGAVRVNLSTAVGNAPARALYEASGWKRQIDYDVYVLKL